MIKKILELYKKNKEIINYLIFGVLTTIVALGTYDICASTFLDVKNPFELQIANVISWVLAVVFAYLTNRKYVFESNNPNKFKEFIKFTSSRLITLILDMLIMFFGVTLLKYNDKIVKIISQIFVIIGNYIFSKLFVFNKIEKKTFKFNKIILTCKNFLNKNSNILITTIIIVLFFVLLVPIINISKYNIPSADDYTYGTGTYNVWKNSHNIFSVFKRAGVETINRWNNWQGTFTAIFLFAIQPSIFGLQYYMLTTIILLTFFIIGNIFLVKTIAKKLFDYNRNSLVCIISFILITFSLEFIPIPRESLFWWNGAIFYTFFYSIMLIAISILIRLIKSTNIKHATINTIISIILSIAIGGGNYCTALQYILIITLLTLILFINKNNNKWNMLSITIIGILSLGISMIAPGNAIRQSNFTNRIGPVASIIKSIQLSAQNCINWTTLPAIFMFLILILPIYQIIKNNNYKFKYPIIFTILTFGIFASQQVPPIYAMNNPGTGRTLDIIYYSYYWLIISNIFYYLGWAKNKFGELKLLDYLYKNILPYTLILILLLLGTLYLQKTYKNSLTYISNNSIKTGEIKQYYEEIIERYKILEDESIKKAVVKPLSVKPSLICGTDLQLDENSPYYWINTGTANYFNKISVNVEK